MEFTITYSTNINLCIYHEYISLQKREMPNENLPRKMAEDAKNEIEMITSKYK